MKKTFLIFFAFCIFLVACQAPTPIAPTSTPVPPPTETPEPLPPTRTAEPTQEANPLYLDATAPLEARVEDLLARMTLAEKIGQMTLIEKNSIRPDEVTEYFVGGILSGGGGSPEINNVSNWVEMVNAFQQAALETRLGIPILYGVDAVHGHGNLKGATIFPHNIGLGATGDADLLTRIGQATAEEMVATGIWWNYAPVVAVVQDIRWGRTYESYGENTELVTTLGTAYMLGLQGDSLADPFTVLATPKHFIGDGGTVWGTSTTNNYQIDQGDMQVDETTLRTLFLPPYQAVVEAGAMSIMASFNSWNGTKMHAQESLLTGVLKGELGFEGFIVSDWAGIDQIDPDFYTSVVTSINAGVDMNMVPYDHLMFINALTQAVEQGDVPLERIDDAVRRILRAKFMLGLFERPFPEAAWEALVGSEEHRELAREAVRKSLVLLQNENAALPIPKNIPLIFIAGEYADNIGVQCGGWTIQWQGEAANITPGTTILEAVEATVSEETQVQYNRFGRFEYVLDANNQPAIANIGIVVVGETPYAEGEGDRADLALTENDIALITQVRAQVSKLIVILLSGRPLIITDHLPLADAWVAAWLPGTEGQGIADVLFGDFPFTGKLSFSWPRSMEQIPLSGLQTSAEPPLFPYGFGLEE
ncbi:MAG: glycoside hydrolase family 3 N-terminal domain-containing protein [Anaerolineales bacterium]